MGLRFFSEFCELLHFQILAKLADRDVIEAIMSETKHTSASARRVLVPELVLCLAAA